ncbi:hypothetical protein EV702DRAFT_1109602, partial [Suillus placidus]
MLSILLLLVLLIAAIPYERTYQRAGKSGFNKFSGTRDSNSTQCPKLSTSMMNCASPDLPSLYDTIPDKTKPNRLIDRLLTTKLYFLRTFTLAYPISLVSPRVLHTLH